MQIDLIKEKEGNQRSIGLAASPDGYPPRKRHFDTTVYGRCKGFMGGGQASLLAQAFEVSPVRKREVVGARIYGAVF